MGKGERNIRSRDPRPAEALRSKIPAPGPATLPFRAAVVFAHPRAAAPWVAISLCPERHSPPRNDRLAGTLTAPSVAPLRKKKRRGFAECLSRRS